MKQRAEDSHERRSGVRWRGALALVIAPFVWVLHHQIGSNVAFAACDRQPDKLSLVIGIAALVLIVVSAVLAWGEWRRAGGVWRSNADQLATFVPLLSLMACAAFGLPVLAQLLADFIVPSCAG